MDSRPGGREEHRRVEPAHRTGPGRGNLFTGLSWNFWWGTRCGTNSNNTMVGVLFHEMEQAYPMSFVLVVNPGTKFGKNGNEDCGANFTPLKIRVSPTSSPRSSSTA
eukprot:3941367-Rhodomonas_salina.4